MDRYGTIGTPRIVHHPSIPCPPSCPQVSTNALTTLPLTFSHFVQATYARQEVRLKMNQTPILSGSECSARKNFGKPSPFGPVHHDSPLNGGGALGMSGGPCSGMPQSMTAGGLHCGQHPNASPTLHHRQHHHSQHPQPLQHLQAGMHHPYGGGGGGGGGGSTEQNGGIGDGDNSSTAGGGGGHHSQFACKNPNKLFGVSPSDIDKYSRVVFPVCFVCFNLMYWIIYLHISSQTTEDLVPAE